MNIKYKSVCELIEEVFDTSSIHGFPYVVRKDFHLLEKCFWLSILIISFYCANEAFSGQLKRYEENPTVLSIEIVSYGAFDRPTFTVCTENFTDLRVIGSVTQSFFSINASNSNYQNYTDFVLTIQGLIYNNLDNLRPFKDLPGIDKVNLMEIARRTSKCPSPGPAFAPIMTERGMCQSSTQHFEWLLPINFSSTKFEKITASTRKDEKCTSLEVCRISVTPNNQKNDTVNRIYINSYDEVMSGDELDYVELFGSNIQERHVKIDDMVADPNIRLFKPKSRKCMFIDEFDPNGFFDLYTPNFCKMTCRIRRALNSKCKCVPYFYPVRNVKFCNVTGLLCLAETDWYDATSCECMKLCETTILTKLSAKDQNLQFDRMLTIDLIFPKTRIKRSVLFDFDDLLATINEIKAH